MPKSEKASNDREHKRLKASFLVKYQTDDGKSKVTNIRDISAGGLSLLVSEMPSSEQMKVNILFPPLGKSFEAIARIIRIRRIKRNFVYSVALEFDDLSEEERKQMNLFIEDVSKSDKASFFIDHANVVLRQK